MTGEHQKKWVSRFKGTNKNEAGRETTIDIKGVQNKSPQNVSLWHVDYFKMKTVKTQQTQEKLLLLP